MSTVSAATGRRLAWPDQLRLVVVAGVVVAHVTTAYVVPIGWYYEERTGPQWLGTALLLPFAVVALFGLGPLFLLGGMMAARSIGRRGPGAFALSRLLRLGVPVLLFLLVVDPVADFVGNRAEGGSRTLAAFLTDLGGDRDVGVFWFVVALLAASLGYAAWRHLRGPAPPSSRRSTADALVRVTVAVTVLNALVWLHWDLLAATPWNVRWGQWPLAVGLFALGAHVTERGADLPPALVRRWGGWAALGLVPFSALVAVGVLVGGAVDGAPALPLWVSMALAPVVAIVAVGSAVYVVELARVRERPLAPLTAAAARASYATYLVHPLVLVALSALARAVGLPSAIALAVVAVVGVPAAFAAGAAVRRLPGLGRVL